MSTPTQDEVNLYLDSLRESGATNMFGAAPYLRREFGMSMDCARDMLTVWMQTFRERHPELGKQMPLYTVKVAVKRIEVYLIEATTADVAGQIALANVDDHPEDVSGKLLSSEPFEGCPYVIETREPKEAK